MGRDVTLVFVPIPCTRVFLYSEILRTLLCHCILQGGAPPPRNRKSLSFSFVNQRTYKPVDFSGQSKNYKNLKMAETVLMKRARKEEEGEGEGEGSGSSNKKPKLSEGEPRDPGKKI